VKNSEKDTLVIKHMYLADHWANKFSGATQSGSFDIEDLRSVGYAALVKAANRFDPNTGTPFPAYATKWVKGNISRFINEQISIASMNSREREDANKIRTYLPRSSILLNDLNREVSNLAEMTILAEMTNLSIARVKQLLPYIYPSTFELNIDIIAPLLDEPNYLDPLTKLINSLPYYEQIHLKRKFGLSIPSKSNRNWKGKRVIKVTLVNRALAKFVHPSRWDLFEDIEINFQQLSLNEENNDVA
jgi:DNA-directed RNA polymerase specialized sigma subunit